LIRKNQKTYAEQEKEVEQKISQRVKFFFLGSIDWLRILKNKIINVKWSKKNKKILLKIWEFFCFEHFIKISKSGKKFPYTSGTKEIITAGKSSTWSKKFAIIRKGKIGTIIFLNIQNVKGKCSFISDQIF
jgi:hypothetical protein